MAAGVGALAAGAWPWWLAPLGDRIPDARAARWSSPADLTAQAISAIRDRQLARRPVEGARGDRNAIQG